VVRLFVALDVGAEVRERIATVQRQLERPKAAVKWVDPASYHLTIKFLGETAETLVPELQTRLDRCAAEVPVFSLKMEGLGTFPDRGPPRVIVSFALSPDQRLTKLHRLIDSAYGGIGLAMDTRVLKAHLTLGRVQGGHGLNKLVRLLRQWEFEDFGSFDVTAAVLYRSTLRPEGSLYEALHRSPLRVAGEGKIDP